MKKRIFLDTNIVIDYLSKRMPFSEDALRIFSLPPRYYQLCISALSFTTIYYVLKKHFKQEELLYKLDILQNLVEVLPTDNEMISSAIHSEFTDFEDAVQYYTALKGNSSIIITRNPKDFRRSEIPVYTPEEFLQIPYFWSEDSGTMMVNEPMVKYRRHGSNMSNSNE